MAKFYEEHLDGKPRHPSISQLLQFFYKIDTGNDKIREIAVHCDRLAYYMADTLPEGPELTAGLRKLLEAKDCFMRVAGVAFSDEQK